MSFPCMLFCFLYENLREECRDYLKSAEIRWFIDSFIHWTTIPLSKHLLCADTQLGTENAVVSKAGLLAGTYNLLGTDLLIT